MIRLDVTTQDSRDSDAMLEDSRCLTSWTHEAQVDQVSEFVDDIGDKWSGLVKSILIVVNLTKGKIMAACMAAKGPHLKEIAYLTLRLARKR